MPTAMAASVRSFFIDQTPLLRVIFVRFKLLPDIHSSAIYASVRSFLPPAAGKIFWRRLEMPAINRKAWERACWTKLINSTRWSALSEQRDCPWQDEKQRW